MSTSKAAATNQTPVVYAAEYGEPTTVNAILRDRAEMTPDELFVRFSGKEVSFGQMLARAERAAAAISSLGIGRGDKVAAMLTNCVDFLDVWFGSNLLGAVLVPVNAGLKGEGLAYIVEHSEARVLVSQPDLLDLIQAAIPADSGPAHRFVLGAEELDGYGSFQELIDGSHPTPEMPEMKPSDLASILYTSGTTGLPKGVMNCHNSYPTAGLEFSRQFVQARAEDVFYTSLPLFHVNAQALTTCGSLVSGRPMVLSPRFSASKFFDDLRENRATVFNYIGAMLTMLYKQPPKPDDADCPARLTVGGAAPAELWKDFEKRFNIEILEIYGLTETATFCLGSPPDRIKAGTIGKAVGWSEVRVEREDGAEAETGESGEIVIRSERPHTLFLGYYKNEEATEDSMKDGWFHSGDRGERDEDGYFIFKDRLKDSIRRRGENISSYELERIVNQHPAVAESAAFGVPSDLGEDEVMVVVVARPDADLDEADLVEFCGERMATFMVPRFIRVVSGLPKTATERVQKFQLRSDGVNGAWDSQAAK